MNVHWWKCEGGGWCHLKNLSTHLVTSYGVYVIWDRVTGVVVRVGQGDVAARLSAHQTDPAITTLGGELLVTWADVSPTFRSGVEKYLASQYRPIIGERYPDTPAIPVNLPGSP